MVMSPREPLRPSLFPRSGAVVVGTSGTHGANISFWGAGNMVQMEEVIWFDKVQLAEVSFLTYRSGGDTHGDDV